MARGASGRIVIEVDPALKNQLYKVLETEGLNMRDWFLANAANFLANRSQLGFDFLEAKTNEKGAKS